LDGCASKAEKPAAQADEERARLAARLEAARWPVDDPPLPRSDGEARDYADLLVATAVGDPGPMVEAASRFRERHPARDFPGAAAYAVAVARDLGGHRDEARTALAALAHDGQGDAARHAADLLASSDYDRLGAFDDAQRRHGREMVRWVLLGGGMDGRSAVYGATQLGAQGVAAAESLGIFNVIGMATRAWQAWRKDPISNQAIIDQGEELLAR